MRRILLIALSLGAALLGALLLWPEPTPDLAATPERGALRHQLAHARHLEGGLLDGLGHDTNIGPTAAFESVLDNTRAGDTDIDDCLRFRNAVESACHKGIVLDRVAENNEFGAA